MNKVKLKLINSRTPKTPLPPINLKPKTYNPHIQEQEHDPTVGTIPDSVFVTSSLVRRHPPLNHHSTDDRLFIADPDLPERPNRSLSISFWSTLKTRSASEIEVL
ncbi:hypothetical protein Hanom_Chr05g00440061 [Helianthus anomalus]